MRSGSYWIIDEAVSYPEREWERLSAECQVGRGTERVACMWPGGEPFMRVPDPALLTEALSESEERGERGSWLTRMR